MKFLSNSIKILVLLVCATLSLHAQVPERPEPQRLYNNLSKEFPDFLSQSEAAALEEKLEQFSNTTSNQICVVIVDDLGGTDAGSFATELGQKWGVGKADKDNGVVVLVKPTKSDGGRDLFIAVGYGLEGAIPDLATKRIRENEIQPLLKEGRYYDALDQGCNTLMKLAQGEINVKDYTRGQKAVKGGALTIIVIIIVVILFLRNMFGGGKGGRTMSSAGEAFFWGSMLGNSMGRRSGGWSGGSSWGGGSSGGGWGGFGGGGFGGGGSGGKW